MCLRSFFSIWWLLIMLMYSSSLSGTKSKTMFTSVYLTIKMTLGWIYVSSPFLGFFFDMCVFASSFIRFYLMTSGYIGVPLVTLWSSNWIQFTCSGLTFDNFPLYCNMQHEDDQIVSTWSMIVWNCHSLVNQWMYPVQHLITSTQKATKGPRWSNCQLISLILHFIILRLCGKMLWGYDFDYHCHHHDYHHQDHRILMIVWPSADSPEPNQMWTFENNRKYCSLQVSKQHQYHHQQLQRDDMIVISMMIMIMMMIIMGTTSDCDVNQLLCCLSRYKDDYEYDHKIDFDHDDQHDNHRWWCWI